MAGDTKRNVSILIKAKDQASSVLRQLKTPLLAIGAVAATVTAAFVGLGVAFSKAVGTAKEQQIADVKLAASLRTLGQNTQEVRDDLTEFANELQDLTITDDRVVKSILGVLSSMGQLQDEGLKRATRLTLDFAAALSQDALAGAQLVSKAAGGMVSVLSRYGLQVDQSIPKTEQFAAVLDQMEKKFGGIAEAMGKTFSGRLARVGNDLNDAAEQIGDIVVRSEGFNRILDLLSKTAKGFQDDIKESEGLMRSFETALLDVTLTAGRATIAFAEIGLTALQLIAKLSALSAGAQSLGERIAFTFGGAPLLSLRRGIAAAIERLGEFAEADIEASTQTAAFENAIQALKNTLRTLDGDLQKEQDRLIRIAELERIVAEEGVNSAKGVSALLQLGRLRADPIKSVEEALGNLPKPAKVARDAVALLKAKLDELGVSAVELNDDFDATEALFGAEVIDAEQFDALVTLIKASGQAIRDAGGDIEDFLTSGGRIPETLIPAFEGATSEIEILGDRIQDILENQAQAGAAKFGDTFIDAAFGAEKAWDHFFQSLIKDFVRAISKALLLRAITSTIGAGSGGGGGFGAFLSSIFGGGVVESAPSIPAALPPAVNVLGGQPVASRREVLPATTNLQVGIFPTPSREQAAIEILEEINELAERKGFRVLATEVIS